MKFIEIINEELDKNGLKRVLNTIQKHFISKLEKKPDSLYPFDGSMVKVDSIYIPLFDFIKDFITSDYNDIMDIFYTFIVKYNPEGNYENVDYLVSLNEKILGSMFNDEVIILSRYFRTSPFLISKESSLYYGLPIYYVYEEENFYCIGNFKQMVNATKEFLKDRYWDRNEIIQSIGVENYIDYLYVEDTSIIPKETDIFEYLLENGFIEVNEKSRIEINKIPSYLKFDLDQFVEDESKHVHFDQLSDYGQVYKYGSGYDEDGTYYMIKIDY
jgi:hypothetical protein